MELIYPPGLKKKKKNEFKFWVAGTQFVMYLKFKTFLKLF